MVVTALTIMTTELVAVIGFFVDFTFKTVYFQFPDEALANDFLEFFFRYGSMIKEVDSQPQHFFPTYILNIFYNKMYRIAPHLELTMHMERRVDPWSLYNSTVPMVIVERIIPKMEKDDPLCANFTLNALFNDGLKVSSLYDIIANQHQFIRDFIDETDYLVPKYLC